MAWFERHLNWTIVIAFFGALLITPFIAFIFLVGTADALIVVIPVVTITVSIWVLRKKNRSMWNLLWLLIPYIGVFIIPLLKNKNTRAIFKVQGNFVHWLRELHNMSPENFANKLGITEDELHIIENGESAISDNALIMLQEVTNVPDDKIRSVFSRKHWINLSKTS